MSRQNMNKKMISTLLHGKIMSLMLVLPRVPSKHGYIANPKSKVQSQWTVHSQRITHNVLNNDVFHYGKI